jgi:tryptophan-rich sensory protein
VQLLFNAAWLRLFFGLRQPDIGFYGLVAMWLMVPYLA